MFKIGEFSKVAQVSIRLLRYYDKIDLLTPAHIDTKTGYRYYTIEQIPRLNRILALKDLGLSLEQVAQLLDDNISPQEIRGMLILKKKQLEQTIQEEIIRLNRVESRLQELETEGQLSRYAPILKSIPEQHYLAHRELAANFSNMGDLIFRTIRAMSDASSQYDVTAAVFYDKAYDVEEIDWAYGYIVDDDAPEELPIDDARTLKRSLLPAVETMITVVHHGSWLHLHRGYTALGRWMSVNRYQFAGYAREVFLQIMPPDKGEMNITEIQFPVHAMTDESSIQLT